MFDEFQFKQFAVRQDQCAMKVGTDGVLLGAWSSATAPDRILDIGTGTGLIALMLAQRFPAAIVDGIEIDQPACRQAADNFRSSPWGHRLNAIHGCVRSCVPYPRYALIVSNPPWFADSLKSPEPARSVARHNDSLRSDDLIAAISGLLADDGQFCAILPVREGRRFIRLTEAAGLQLQRLCEVQPNPDTPPKRLLIQFCRAASAPVSLPVSISASAAASPTASAKPSAKPSAVALERLIIETSRRHEYTPEFRELAGEFYLKL